MIYAHQKSIVSRSVTFKDEEGNDLGLLKKPWLMAAGYPLETPKTSARLYLPFFLEGPLARAEHGFILRFDETSFEAAITHRFRERVFKYEGQSYRLQGASWKAWQLCHDDKPIGEVHLSRRLWSPCHTIDLPDQFSPLMQMFLFGCCYLASPVAKGV